MITAFVGCINDNLVRTPIRGNGKTLAMTYAGFWDFLDGRTIISNYKIDYITFNTEAKNEYKKLSKEEQKDLNDRLLLMPVKDMVKYILEVDINEKNPNGYSLLIDEIHTIISALGTSSKVIKFFDRMQSQSRKRKTDIYWTSQRFNNVDKRCRVHTDYKYICQKIHKDVLDNDNIYETCFQDECKKEHLIHIINYDDMFTQKFIPVNIYGQMYDSDEIINEEFNL
jgi:hypothetical protein